MQDLINKINELKQNNIKNIVSERIQEFKNIDKESCTQLFEEMCFCILTANYNAEKCIKIQDEIGCNFSILSKDKLTKKLTQLGHRYPNARAGYIDESKKHKDLLKNVINSNNGIQRREWLVKNVKGLGYKESSHFLRNIGFDDYAIIDFHIIDLLVRYKLIKKPKSLDKKAYLEIENVLRTLAKKTDLTLSELDLYLWYMETGKILK